MLLLTNVTLNMMDFTLACVGTLYTSSSGESKEIKFTLKDQPTVQEILDSSSLFNSKPFGGDFKEMKISVLLNPLNEFSTHHIVA